MILGLYIGTSKLDMFDDESIEVNSSIADVNDITKNTTHYAKTFTVPASDTNNAIFKHYYDANIDNSFDARIKHDGSITLDGMLFRSGKFTLDKVSLKSGIASSYSISFVGNLISLKDELGEAELSDLDLTAYNHAYDSDTIKGYLQTDGDLIYNLFVKKQLFYDSSGVTTSTDTSTNVSYLNGDGIAWNLIKPSIRLIKVIEAIETKYPALQFSRDFFGTPEFNNLYLWLNNTSTDTPVSNSVKIDFNTSGTITSDYGILDLTEDTFQMACLGRVFILITPSVGYETVPYDIERKLNGTSWGTYSNLVGTTNNAFTASLDTNLHTFYVYSEEEFKFTARLEVARLIPSGSTTATFSEQTISDEVTIEANLPKIKIIDFLKGLFQMFKLVILTEDDGTLYVDTIQSYYAKGVVWNLTEYINRESLEVSRGNLLNKISLKFKQPTTILNKQFKEITGQYYGDEEVILTDDGTATGQLLDGNPLEIELPFEQIVYERLPDLADDTTTNIMYAPIIDDKLAAVAPAPHIFYNINTSIGTKTIGFINDSNVKEELTTTINTPSHSIDFVSQQYNLNWGTEKNEWTNVASENTLYVNHYKDYLEAIFNPKQRRYNYKARLPLNVLLKIKLNDILEIGTNNYYRFDNFGLNSLTQEASLNLVKSFDTNIGGFYPSSTFVVADYLNQTVSITFVGSNNITINEVDTGDGVTWLDSSVVGNTISFEFDLNNLRDTRTMQVEVVNNNTLQEFTIDIVQTGTYIPSLRFFDEYNSQYLHTIIN